MRKSSNDCKHDICCLHRGHEGGVHIQASHEAELAWMPGSHLHQADPATVLEETSFYAALPLASPWELNNEHSRGEV